MRAIENPECGLERQRERRKPTLFYKHIIYIHIKMSYVTVRAHASIDGGDVSGYETKVLRQTLTYFNCFGVFSDEFYIAPDDSFVEIDCNQLKCTLKTFMLCLTFINDLVVNKWDFHLLLDEKICVYPRYPLNDNIRPFITGLDFKTILEIAQFGQNSGCRFLFRLATFEIGYRLMRETPNTVVEKCGYKDQPEITNEEFIEKTKPHADWLFAIPSNVYRQFGQDLNSSDEKRRSQIEFTGVPSHRHARPSSKKPKRTHHIHSSDDSSDDDDETLLRILARKHKTVPPRQVSTRSNPVFPRVASQRRQHQYQEEEEG